MFAPQFVGMRHIDLFIGAKVGIFPHICKYILANIVHN